MKKQHVFFGLLIAAVVIALYYYLRGNGQAMQTVYPNTQASGQPAAQNPASVFNISTGQQGPSPAAIYAPPLALPPTPGYQSYNYAPLNIYGNTAAAATTARPTLVPKCDSCSGSCGSCSSCPTCPTGGTYSDSNSTTCLASNPVQPVANPSNMKYFAAASDNIQSFFGA